MSKERFFTHLKTHFAPRLRDIGFTGSGQNFRRVVGEVIHAINLQGNKWGGSCAVNLGLHLTFLPTEGLPKPANPRTVTEIDCAFRGRLAKRGESDCWWPYELPDNSPEEAADDLISRYFEHGESRFQRFRTADDVVSSLQPDRFRTGDWRGELPGTPPIARTALMAARIYAHLGRDALRRESAQFALANLGHASGLREELERLAR